MGLFDFFRRDAGKKAAGDAAPTPEFIKAEVQGLGLNVQDLDVAVSGETVTVKGRAASQEDREKAVLAAGNVHGVTKVDDQITVDQATSGSSTGGTAPGGTGSGSSGAETRYHTVEKGDTLSKISKQFYGDANKYMTIFNANRPMLKDPDAIYPGQVLRIPAQP